MKNEYIDCGDHFEIILTYRNGEEKCRAKISKSDFDKAKNTRWFMMGSYALPYVTGKISGKRVLLHRFLLNFPDDHVDHVNGDGLDNRRENIRTATQSQNMMNRKARKGLLVGISQTSRAGTWVAEIKAQGRKYHLGCYQTLEEAVAARKAGEIILHGEYSGRYRQ